MYHSRNCLLFILRSVQFSHVAFSSQNCLLAKQTSQNCSNLIDCLFYCKQQWKNFESCVHGNEAVFKPFLRCGNSSLRSIISVTWICNVLALDYETFNIFVIYAQISFRISKQIRLTFLSLICK